MAEMPAAEHDVDVQLVAGLLADQHPDLVDLRLGHLAHGWDNESYRLGDDMIVRLPRRQAAAELVVHEQRWLGDLARMVRLPIPAPLRIGHAGRGFPWSWSVVPWLPGDRWEATPPLDVERAATDLGAFLSELHRPAPLDAPRNPLRGVPLADRAARFDAALSVLADRINTDRCRALFNRLVTTPPWTGPPVWIHGDLHPLNLLVADGQLSAVIDWGDVCAGDPATDLSVAWMVLPVDVHPAFRLAAGIGLAIDDATWARARGWALALSVAMLSFSDDDPTIAGIGTRTLHAVLESAAE